MKNLRKSCLALAAVSALGISANATSLQESLSGGKLSGEIRSFSIFANKTDTVESSLYNNTKASAIALQLNYETADFHGFKAQVGFQSGHDFHIGEDAGPPLGPNASEDEPRATAQGTNLYLANLSYTAGNTVAKFGRQLITTPLIVGSNVHPLRDSFYALSVVNKDLPQTEVEFYAIKEWYQRYTAEFGSSRATHFDDPVYSLHAKNKSIPGLTLEGQYMTTDDAGPNGDAPINITGGYSTYFGSFDYKLPTSHFIIVGGLYAGATFDNNAEDDATMYGLKVGTKIGSTFVKLAYTSVDDDNDFPGALGHTPNFFKYNGGQMFTDNIYAGTDAVSLLVIPNFGIKGVKTLFSYASYSQSDTGKAISGHDMDGASELQADLRYEFSGAFKGLSARLQTAFIDYDDESVQEDELTVTRIYLNYKF